MSTKACRRAARRRRRRLPHVQRLVRLFAARGRQSLRRRPRPRRLGLQRRRLLSRAANADGSRRAAPDSVACSAESLRSRRRWHRRIAASAAHRGADRRSFRRFGATPCAARLPIEDLWIERVARRERRCHRGSAPSGFAIRRRRAAVFGRAPAPSSAPTQPHLGGLRAPAQCPRLRFSQSSNNAA